MKVVFEVSELFVHGHIGIGLKNPDLRLDFIQKFAMFSRSFRVLQCIDGKNIKI
jgi:hypothetical protein